MHKKSFHSVTGTTTDIQIYFKEVLKGTKCIGITGVYISQTPADADPFFKMELNSSSISLPSTHNGAPCKPFILLTRSLLMGMVIFNDKSGNQKPFPITDDSIDYIHFSFKKLNGTPITLNINTTICITFYFIHE